MTVDVEEYFQGPQFEHLFGMERWGEFERRVHVGLDKLLNLFAEFDIRATFFILTWNVERDPRIVYKIHSAGHEIACHGRVHTLLYNYPDPRSFRTQLERSVRTLEDLTGEAVLGYRAPAFTIVPRTWWVLDILVELGFKYDASIFPIRRRRYGIPSAPRFRHLVNSTNGKSLVEFPPSTIRFLGQNLPIAGGGYLRLYPYVVTCWGIRRINREGQPAIIYVHPWELDPDQPPVRVGPRTRFTHYYGLQTTENKIRRLLNDFSFCPLRDAL
ncbi:MAG: DUF3473 domain-containing protein [Anaerolineae bacterium]